jgi:hypothetical protein
MKPLSPADFVAPALTRDLARASVAYVPDGVFNDRWDAAIEGGALQLLRSFPALWWRDVRAVDPARVPTGKTLAFGDAHLENFGFLAFDKGGVGFTFNDLDDSGEVEVALDALRYFTSVALAGEDIAPLIVRWVDDLAVERSPVLTDKATLNTLGAPARSKMRDDAVERWSLEPTLSAVSKDELKAVKKALKETDETRDYTVYALQKRQVKSGGSGGLARYWALARVPDGAADDLDVLELKERAPAAAEEGARARKIDKRLTTMKKALWPGLTLTPYRRVEVIVGETTRSFVVRSRGVRAGVKAPCLAEQVRVLAAVHRGAEMAVSRAELGRWVEASVPTLVARWKALHALKP